VKTVVLLLALTVSASAEEAINCADVRAVVQTIGKTEALRLAREAGASETRIKRARRCLRR
jgi:hypothetical protein